MKPEISDAIIPLFSLLFVDNCGGIKSSLFLRILCTVSLRFYLLFVEIHIRSNFSTICYEI